MRWLVPLAVAGCSFAESTATIATDFHTRGVAPAGDGAAYSLTASDGRGLALVALEAKAVIEGPLAFTELHLRFRNPEDRVREGTFAITLPARAAISRFAMVEPGGTKEAEVVPKALARTAYEDFLHANVDPALLETAVGNQFTARVFPIPARGTKHLILSYSQELANDGYVLPLRGLPAIDDVSIRLDAVRPDGSRDAVTMVERAWHPDRDFVADVVTAPAIGHGTLVAAAFDVAADAAARADRPAQLTLLVDTSGSRTAGFTRYVHALRALTGELGRTYEGLVVDVIAFDQDAQRIYRGPASQLGERELAPLAERGPAGASDLGHAAAFASGRAVIVTDGVITAGLEGAVLAQRFRAERVDVILTGGIRDERTAATLARAGKRAGDVFDLDRASSAAIARGLGESVRVDVPIEVTGASWVYPRKLSSVRAGSQLTVFAQLAAPADGLEVRIGDRVHVARIAPATPALLERAVARARIDELETQLAANPTEDTRRELEELSVASRVMSTQTTLLVLEREQDYERYRIDRKALADILVVGPRGLEHTKRTFVASAEPPRALAPPERLAATQPSPDREAAIREARHAGLLGSHVEGGFAARASSHDLGAGFGAGRYGTIGAGSGTSAGYGRGGVRVRTANVPRVAIAMPVVMGDLDKSIIRRYIKRNLAKISYCYERELLARPKLAGIVTAQFLIAADGRVKRAIASGMDPTVARCVASVIERIEFPRVSNGGSVQVNYPFRFVTAGTRVPLPEPVAPLPPPPAYDGRPDDPMLAVDGELARVLRAIAAKDAKGALAIARAWRTAQPSDVLAWIGLGEAYEALGDRRQAARAYGAIIDHHASRAELRRLAGERLERLGIAGRARAVAIDTYRRAVADRPDQLTGHRLLAYALVRGGDPAGAFAAILRGVDQQAPANRFAGAERVLAEDAGMIGAAYIARGGSRDEVTRELGRRGLAPVSTPSLRAILYWETDANDVDLHIADAHGRQAWYARRHLASGGELYADVTTGFGPECFAIEGKPEAGPYAVSVQYYAQGSQGHGMGLLQIARFDGKAFAFEDHPFVITKPKAHVALGKIR